MYDIGNLEIHAWHGCNLSCASCSHYSSLGLRGGPDAKTCISWMRSWSSRLRPKTFSILGGEPCANPELVGVLEAAVTAWPESEIRLVTNGLLLHRHPRLAEALGAAPRAVLVVSSHHPSTEYQALLAPVRELVTEWHAAHGVNYRIVEADRFWTRRYKTTESGVSFYESEPRAAWKACVGKFCLQLFENSVWKCPPVAYLNLLSKVRRVDSSTTKICGSYKPLASNCSDEALVRFFSTEEEPVCAICPERPEAFELGLPFKRTERQRLSAK